MKKIDSLRFNKKKILTFIFLELISLAACIPIGILCAYLNVSNDTMSGIIVTYLFISMSAIPFAYNYITARS